MGIEFKKITQLPDSLLCGEIEKAVKSFVADSHAEEANVDPEGMRKQTLQSIAERVTYPVDGRQFWIAEHEGELLTYVLAHVGRDVDNELTYWLTQAWVNPKVRGHKIVKLWYSQLVAEAKRLMCKHMMIISSRGDKAYQRFLGREWHQYAILLKKDL